MKLCPFLTEIRKKIKNFEPLRGVNCSTQRRIAAKKTFRIKVEIVGFAKKKRNAPNLAASAPSQQHIAAWAGTRLTC